MNRREFCFSLGAAVGSGVAVYGGSVVSTPVDSGIVATPVDEHPVRFRAKKVFLESWDAETLHANSPVFASFVRNQLTAIRRDGCDTLILVPGRCAELKRLKQIDSEASRLGLAILVPTQLTRNFFREVHTVIPLAHERETFHNLSGKTANDGGFLLVNESDNVIGLVLYDASRCLWAGYAAPDAAHVHDAEYYDNDSQLVAARWIDQTRLSLKSEPKS